MLIKSMAVNKRGEADEVDEWIYGSVNMGQITTGLLDDSSENVYCLNTN